VQCLETVQRNANSIPKRSLTRDKVELCHLLVIGRRNINLIGWAENARYDVPLH
jgi:hypothetical protein